MVRSSLLGGKLLMPTYLPRVTPEGRTTEQPPPPPPAPPPAPLLHCWLMQRCRNEQLSHAWPKTPQADSWSPARQSPLLLQQPLGHELKSQVLPPPPPAPLRQEPPLH